MIQSILLALLAVAMFALGYYIAAHERKPEFNFIKHLYHQREMSQKNFGPGFRWKGVLDHITKEIEEVRKEPADILEWIDLIILSCDGALRIPGVCPEDIIENLKRKQEKNDRRVWPDWRTQDPEKAIEHDRSHDIPDSTEDDIPMWIRIKAAPISVLKAEGNIAKGEIVKMSFATTPDFSFNEQVVGCERGYDWIWRHIADGTWFKVVGKWPESQWNGQ